MFKVYMSLRSKLLFKSGFFNPILFIAVCKQCVNMPSELLKIYILCIINTTVNFDPISYHLEHDLMILN